MSNEKRVNKQCSLDTPHRVTVYHKNYFGYKFSSCKCPMDLHHVGIMMQIHRMPLMKPVEKVRKKVLWK